MPAPDRSPVADPVARLQARTVADIGRHLPVADRWVAVDYPMHHNVGDSAIMLGQAELAGRRGSGITRMLDRASYRPHLLEPGALVVLAGGGTWGGLYQTHHRLRLRALQDTRGRPVVQMPQSIHYASETHREELRRAVAEHGALVLLVRDRRSYEVALRDYDCAIHLVPDLVFALGRLDAPAPSVDVVHQARTDKEAPVDASLPQGAFDWLEPPPRSPSRVALQLAVTANRAQRRLPQRLSGPLGVGATSALSRSNVRRGVALLARGRTVVTDRLHGHVLAHLMGRPHVVVDDRFGKIRALHETWLDGDRGSVLVRSWADVPEALESLGARR